MEKGLVTPEAVLETLARDIRFYRETHPWHIRAIKDDGQTGRDLYNALRRIAYAEFGPARGSDAPAAAKLVGIPFDEHLPTYDPNKAKRLFKDFNTIHPVLNGKRSYLSPKEVKTQHQDVYARAVTHFGSYRSALMAWQKKAYEKSVTRHHPDMFTKDELFNRAKHTIRRVFEKHGYVTLFHLRNAFPQEHRAVSAGMVRKKYQYEWLVKAAGFAPVKETERNMLGHIGELFSFAALYPANKELTLPFFPGYGNRIEIIAPNNKHSKTGITHPDIGFSDDGETLRIKEVKAGLYYETAKAHDAITKYSSDTENPLRFATSNAPVIFDSIDLHFSPDRIQQESLAAFNEAEVRVHTPAHFEELFQRELADTYRAFIHRPLPFARRKNVIRQLEDLVLETAPARIQDEVERMRTLNSYKRQQRRNELKEEAPF